MPIEDRVKALFSITLPPCLAFSPTPKASGTWQPSISPCGGAGGLPTSVSSTDFHAVSDPRVARALSFMTRNSSEILSVPDIARHVGVGRQTLERGFHEQLGRTVNDSTSSGGAGSVPGTVAFPAPATQPDAGTATGGVTFTPDDALDYQPASTSVNVTVNPAMTAFDT